MKWFTAPSTRSLGARPDVDLNQLHRTGARLPLLRDERTGW